MKKMYLKAIAGITLLMTAVLTTAHIPAQTGGQNALGKRIEGTWHVEITLLDCQTGAPLIDPATGQPLPHQPALNTFLAGGSMLSDPAVPPAALRTGHGVWEHTGGQRFANKVVLFRFNPMNGAYEGTVTVTREIELDASSDQFTANDVAEPSDPAGNPLPALTRCAFAVGRRLE